MSEQTNFVEPKPGEFTFSGMSLIEAIDTNDWFRIKHLIEVDHIDIHYREDWPILRAVVKSKWNLVAYLISQGADWKKVSGFEVFETKDEILKFLVVASI